MQQHIQLHPHFEDGTHHANNPLWHSKYILSCVNKAFITCTNCIQILCLDELRLATKCRTRAKTYLTMKSNPYSLRFYGLSGVGPSSVPYLFSFVNNGSDDTSSILQVKKYLSQHSSLHTTCDKCIEKLKIIDPESASAP